VTVRRTPNGKYNIKWRDAVALGRARKRAARPKRDILLVQSALRKLNLRYCLEISFWNSLHRGKHSDLNGGLQWVDAVAWGHNKAVPIILDDPQKRWKEYEKSYHANKQAGLVARHLIPLILPKGRSSQEYTILIYRHIKKHNL
jgi:hypothetical protein